MRAKKTIHEEKICKSLIDVINYRQNQLVTHYEKLDLKNREEEEVDFLLWRDKSKYAVVEHTRIETYKGQIHEDHLYSEYIKPLAKRLDGKLPSPGHYKLIIPANALSTTVNKKEMIERIEMWVKNKASGLISSTKPRLKESCYIKERIPPIPFELILSRHESSLEKIEGRCLIGVLAPDELEQKRVIRLKKALDDKAPKLFKAKNKHKCKSILIIESNDLSLANHVVIAEALLQNIALRKKDIPDIVYLMETDIEPWTTWILKEEGIIFPNIVHIGPYYHNVNYEKD